MTDHVAPEDIFREAPKDTDLGNCRRFARDWRYHARYIPPWKSYIVWDGKRWLRDEVGQAVEMAKATVHGIYREAAYAETDDDRKALAKHARKSEAASRIMAMLELARSEPGIPATADDFDRDPMSITVDNGTLDLRVGGALRPHRQSDMITKLLPVAYDPAAACPRWDAFLMQIMDGKAEVVRFLQKAIGYSLTGLTREQVFFLLHGSGSNGKSTMIEVLTTMLGDYASMASMDTFMQKDRETIPNDIARLHGVRFVAATESEHRKRLAEALVKSLTGGDRVVARFLNKEFFEFTPRFKIFLATNHLPNIRGRERAIWRRIRVIPFTVTIPDDEQDKDFVSKLAAEYPGILRWAVEGCRLWQDEGLAMPDEIKTAIAAYRSESDVLGAFLDERCDLEPALSATASTLFEAYTKWAKRGREYEMSQTAFGRALTERGFKQDRTGSQRFWTGLAVRPDPDADGPSTREPGDERVPF